MERKTRTFPLATILTAVLIGGLVGGYSLGLSSVAPRIMPPAADTEPSEKVKTSESQLASLQARLKDKDAEIANLKQQIKELQTQIEAVKTAGPEESKTGITGTITLIPEVQGKIEVKHRLIQSIYYGKWPVVEVTIKNIGNEPISGKESPLGKGIYFQVISKDSSGQKLGASTKYFVGAGQMSHAPDSTQWPGILEPKEIRTWLISTFPSDEVKSYEIVFGSK